jgi:uncharacterized membrane protein YraQ (UPF0718 family)
MDKKTNGRMKMDITSYIMVGIAAMLLLLALRQGRAKAWQGLLMTWSTLWRNLPLLLISSLIAGLVQVLFPKELISNWLGSQAGVKGIFIGCLLGGLVPGSPYVVFPIVASLYRTGASLAAVVSFVSAWALWSISRLPIEMALIEPKAALVRYAITFLMPPIAGFIALSMSHFLN